MAPRHATATSSWRKKSYPRQESVLNLALPLIQDFEAIRRIVSKFCPVETHHESRSGLPLTLGEVAGG